MKSVINLEDGWFIRKINPVDRLDERMIAECEGGSAEELPARMPAQVHEILLRHGKIKDPAVMEIRKNAAGLPKWTGYTR